METEEENKYQNENNLISLENCDYKSKTNRITSPRSIEAIESLGVNKKDLYQISFQKFKSQNSDVQELPKELQKFRYDSLENFRNKTINQVKEKRQNLIEEEENNNINNKYNYNEKDNKNKRKLDPKMEKLLEEQKATIQKIKNKQKYDIEQIIEAQLQKEIDLKNTAEKEREKKEKEKEKNEGNKTLAIILISVGAVLVIIIIIITITLLRTYRKNKDLGNDINKTSFEVNNKKEEGETLLMEKD
jgi:hypothetical protein